MGGAIIWDKEQPLLNRSSCEIASVSKTKIVHKYTQTWTNYVNEKETTHPTEKPVKLFVWIINKFTEKNELVLDPFMGSGTTAVACEQLQRKWIGIEISEAYCSIIKNRLSKWKGQQRLEFVF